MTTATYLDNAASTQIHPDVFNAMLPFLKEHYGNPSSIHRNGRIAKKAIQKARKQIALLVNADPLEIFFTSGGTESDNLALYGFVKNVCDDLCYDHNASYRIITSTIEHDAVLEPCRNLKDKNIATIDYIPVNKHGIVDIGKLAKLLEKPIDNSSSIDVCNLQQKQKSTLTESFPTTLVSIMYANNEVGTIQPISEIAQICHDAGAIFHTDAVQAVGKIPVDVKKLGIDMMSISSHKIHGPKGIGALYVRCGTQLAPRMLGGGQEHGIRSGTENVAGIVGFGDACVIARENLNDNVLRVRELRDALACRILYDIPHSVMNGSADARLPGNAHFTFLGINGEDLLIKLDEYGIAASTGSACSVNRQKASHVLQAMGFTHEQITGSLRLSLSVFNTIEEIHHTADILKEVVHELRMVSPFKSKYVFDDNNGGGGGGNHFATR